MHVIQDPGRPAAIEDPVNTWLIHRLAIRLLPVALRLGIHPNTVSLAGLGFGILAGVAYWHWREPLCVVAGLVLMLGWHVMDGLDGKLARASGKASAFGRLIDGICDYLVFVVVMLPLALTFADGGATLILCLAGGLCHAVQAAWYEGEREGWRRRAEGRFTARSRPATGSILEVGHNWLEAKLGSGRRPIDDTLARDPARLAAYLLATAPWLRRAAIVDANNRSLALAIACLAGEPRFYWAWEIIGLSLVAFGVAARLRRVETGISAMALPAPPLLEPVTKRRSISPRAGIPEQGGQI